MRFVKGKSGNPHGRGKLKVEKIPVPKIDWGQIMVDLYNAKCPANRVATHIGVAGCTANNWLKGGEPKYGAARALLRLHASYCGSALTILRQYSGAVADTPCSITTSALAIKS